jgi:hypothetical protein
MIDNTILDNLMTPRERLEEIAKMNPSQIIAVAIVDNTVKVSWDFLEEKHMISMLTCLERELQKEIQLRRNKSFLKLIKEKGTKINE